MRKKPKAKAKSKLKTKSKVKAKSVVAKSSGAAQRLGDLADWRTQTLARMRALILEADPEIVEERKWRKPSNPAGVPTFLHHGIVCTGETYKQVVKLTFAHGASVPDPSGLFNSSLEGNQRRAIDIRQGESVDADAFRSLVKAAVARNASTKTQ